MKVGIVTLTWNQFKRAAPDEWPEARVLREVKEAGFDAVSMGLKAGQSPQELLEYLDGFGLKPAPGYMGGNFWQPEEREKHIEAARLRGQQAQAIGMSELFVAAAGGNFVSRADEPSGGKTRHQLSGHVGPDDGLNEAEYQDLAATLDAMGRAMLESGVRLCVHNHVGQVIETREEVDKLFALTDPEAVFLGPDIGHLTWAGSDAVSFCRDYATQIKALHLKDITQSVRDEGRDAQWIYGQFSQAGVFTELGQGMVDYPALFEVLRGANYDGWLLSEIDVTQKPTALQSATECRAFLKTMGE